MSGMAIGAKQMRVKDTKDMIMGKSITWKIISN